MEILMEKYYAEKGVIKYFYIDRVLRIFPQFAFYLVVTLLLNYLFPINENISSFIRDINLVNVIQNILIIPLGYFMFDGLANCQVVPQAWTLGLELTFYIIFPFIYFKNKKIFFSIVSILVFMMAYSGVINSDWFGYRLLPGTLFIFLIGAIIRSSKYEKEKNKIIFIWLASIILLINLYINSKYQLPYNKEVLLGLLIGIPILIYLKDKKMTKLDSLLGNLSYGIYLNHFFVMYIAGKIPQTTFGRLKLVIASIILAYISFKFIEQPVMNFRKKYRKNVLSKDSSDSKNVESELV